MIHDFVHVRFSFADLHEAFLFYDRIQVFDEGRPWGQSNFFHFLFAKFSKVIGPKFTSFEAVKIYT